MKTIKLRQLKEAKERGNALWKKEIYPNIKGKQLPFERISIPVPFESFNGFTSMQISMSNTHLPYGQLRVFLSNGKDEKTGINISRGFVTIMGKRTLADQLEANLLRADIFSALAPVVKSLSPILFSKNKKQRAKVEKK